MDLLTKIQNSQKKLTVKEFTLKQEADQLGRKAAKLDIKKDKTKKESEQVKELRKEATRIRKQQEQAKRLNNRMGLGEKILRCYFTYKLSIFACHTITALTENCHGRDEAIGRAVTNGIDRTADKIADHVTENTNDGQNINEQRAQMIEQTLASFERMSQEAEEQGLTREGEPLLTDEDRKKIQELADISRDTHNEQQAEQYAAKCQELGMDYSEAMEAFRQDKNLDTVSNDIEKGRQDKAQEAPAYELTI